MPINHREIVSDIREHIQKSGGSFGGWWVGTAKDSRGAFFESHRVAELNDGFIYREAYTPTGALEARDYLVNECGLRLDLEDVPEPGLRRRLETPVDCACHKGNWNISGREWARELDSCPLQYRWYQRSGPDTRDRGQSTCGHWKPAERSRRVVAARHRRRVNRRAEFRCAGGMRSEDLLNGSARTRGAYDARDLSEPGHCLNCYSGLAATTEHIY